MGALLCNGGRPVMLCGTSDVVLGRSLMLWASFNVIIDSDVTGVLMGTVIRTVMLW